MHACPVPPSLSTLVISVSAMLLVCTLFCGFEQGALPAIYLRLPFLALPFLPASLAAADKSLGPSFQGWRGQGVLGVVVEGRGT